MTEFVPKEGYRLKEEKTPKKEPKVDGPSKNNARERIELLLDPISFQEIGVYVHHNVQRYGMDQRDIPGDGVVAGFGQIDGRDVGVYAFDRAALGGSLGEAAASKICRLLDYAIRHGMPVISLIESGGARIQEGVGSLAGYGEVFRRNVQASGIIPQISVIYGPSAGGAVYSPALTDFIIMVEGTGQMFITGPNVIEEVTGERPTFEELGGSSVHATKSGVAHLVAQNEEESFQLIRDLLSYLPSNSSEISPWISPGFLPSNVSHGHPQTSPDDTNVGNIINLRKISQLGPKQTYDMRDVLYAIIDDVSFLEIQDKWATNIITGFARLDGFVVGIVANQPQTLMGVLDTQAAQKAARFVRFCDAFNIPILTLVDVPGYLPGVDQEHSGIIRHGAKLLYAYSEASVPRITVIVRKAYGGAYIVMGSKHLGSDFSFAWPSAEIAVMGSQGAVNILHRRQIVASDNPNELRAELQEKYQTEIVGPYIAAERGFIDDIIQPENTRLRLITALRTLTTKTANREQKKHGNIPL
ncbi:MAG: acyl-CoA carboxylase subunit beta [Candidatus Hodarchaeota archaeon]